MDIILSSVYIFVKICLFLPGSSGAHLLSDPFQCCVLPNFIHDTTSANGNNNDDVSTLGGTGFLHQLKDELLRLKFYEKNNDLYQFHQVSNFAFLLYIYIVP